MLRFPPEIALDSLVRLHLLDQLRSIRRKCGNRLDILHNA
jgi:hypothetical protein